MITSPSSKSGKGFIPPRPPTKVMRILLPLPRVSGCCLPQTHKARWCPRKLSGPELPPRKLSLFLKTAIPTSAGQFLGFRVLQMVFPADLQPPCLRTIPWQSIHDDHNPTLFASPLRCPFPSPSPWQRFQSLLNKDGSLRFDFLKSAYGMGFFNGLKVQNQLLVRFLAKHM